MCSSVVSMDQLICAFNRIQAQSFPKMFEKISSDSYSRTFISSDTKDFLGVFKDTNIHGIWFLPLFNRLKEMFNYVIIYGEYISYISGASDNLRNITMYVYVTDQNIDHCVKRVGLLVSDIYMKRKQFGRCTVMRRYDRNIGKIDISIHKENPLQWPSLIIYIRSCVSGISHTGIHTNFMLSTIDMISSNHICSKSAVTDINLFPVKDSNCAYHIEGSILRYGQRATGVQNYTTVIFNPRKLLVICHEVCRNIFVIM